MATSKEQEGPTDIIHYTDTIQAKKDKSKVVKVPDNDLPFSNSLELNTETELAKNIAGNLVNASDAITNNESAGDNSSETVKCAERCKGSDEELPKNINQSSEGYTGNPDYIDELSNACTAGCKRGNSGNGPGCINNEKVASEDELASSVIPLEENESGEITNQIVCEKKIDDKFDEIDCKSEGKISEADQKVEVGNFNASSQRGEIDELATETELDKNIAGNFVNASDAITDNESEGDNSSETVECAERCNGSDEELPKNINQSLEGYTGNPDKDELSNTCSAGCERGNSGNGSGCIDNEKVASEDELSRSVIPLQENESGKISNQIVCEKKIDDKFDEIDCKSEGNGSDCIDNKKFASEDELSRSVIPLQENESGVISNQIVCDKKIDDKFDEKDCISEGKISEADQKVEVGNFNDSCPRGEIDEIATETELDKKIAGNLVNASDAITNKESEADNSSETVECAERCKGSDEELPKNINQSLVGYTGNPDKDKLSNTCTAGCERGNSGNGSECIDNEKVASEDELASSVIPWQENESEEITNQIVCEKKIDDKFDEIDCKSEGKISEADQKVETGNFNASCQRGEIDELATETELDKKIAGNLVNASDGITDNESEGDKSSETVECTERCEGSDEELPKNINQSSEGYIGNPDKDELSNICTAGCQRGNSGNGSDCIDNEKVASEDELSRSVIPWQENESEEITNQIVYEKKIDDKFDEKDCISEGKKSEADRKYEAGNFNASCQSDEIDEVEGNKGVESKNASVITSTTVTSDKIKIFKITSFYYVKVAYKFSKGYTKNIWLQTIFICTMMYQQYDPEFFISKNTISAYLLEDMIQDFYIGNQEYNVFAVLENYLTSVAMAMFLPEPDLPRSTVELANTLGINLRPYFQNTTNSESMDRLQPRVDNPRSIQHTGTSSGSHQSNDELQRCSEFISISSLPMTATVREGETDSQQDQRCTRINDVPALPVPNQLSLDEGSTNRKETQPVRNIFRNIIQSRQSADGSPSSATTNLRGRNIPTVGTYSLERIPEYASHLSNSVSEQPSQQISDDMVFEEEQMSNAQARARTFDGRWPHRHLNPDDMARAGLYYTGEEDMTRCFDCDIGLGKWETDDSPFTEHRRLSPECQYIQSLCQNDPQLFGASGQVGTGDAASGGQQNDIQGLGHRRTIYRQMSRENSGRLVPHCEHGDNDSTIYSELLQAQSCESEHTGIQESGSNTGLTMFAVTENSRTLQDSPNLDSANVNELIGTDQTFDAIDNELDFYRGSQAVRMVLSEGYSQREVDIAVEDIISEDGIITVNALMYKLQYLGFTPKN